MGYFSVWQLSEAQEMTATALSAKEQAENELLSKFVQLLNQKKLKIRELWEKLSYMSSGGSSSNSSGPVPRLEDRPMSLRGRSQPIDDSDEGDDDDFGARPNEGNDSDSSEDLAQSITGSYNSQAANSASATRKKSKSPAKPARKNDLSRNKGSSVSSSSSTSHGNRAKAGSTKPAANASAPKVRIYDLCLLP